MADPTNQTDGAIVSAFSQTDSGFTDQNVVIRHYPGGAFTARGEHGSLTLDVTRTAQGEVRVRYLDRSTEAHAFAEYGPSGSSVQILGGRSEAERLVARDAAGALARRIDEAASTSTGQRPAPIRRPGAGLTL
jgi:hypothetical protein